MATFITTNKFTDQGLKSIGGTTKLASSFKAGTKKLGVKVAGQSWVLSAFDGLLVFGSPMVRRPRRLCLHHGSLDYVYPSTARAFSTTEMDKVLTKLPRPRDRPAPRRFR